MSDKNTLHRIVIVGGGAGGLELATRLGDKLRKNCSAEVTLIDPFLTHIWKPLLHEVAAGSLNSYEDELGYLGQAHQHHFKFRLGEVDMLNPEKQEVSTKPTFDQEGKEFIPRRYFLYDSLVFSVGSITNDFDIPGVREHCHFLDRRQQADNFHQNLLKSYYTGHTQTSPLREGQLKIAIAGAGATGVELAAELYASIQQMYEYGLDQISNKENITITIIEAAERLLPALPARLSDKTKNALEKLGIKIELGQRIVEATATGFNTDSGKFIPAEIKVWAAGIKAPVFLKGIENLETNSINQLVVLPTLQTTRYKNIFAFGDCAACPMLESDEFIPPRAQAAHQQAKMLVKSIQNHLKNKKLPEFSYIDYGSLINMSQYSTVGNLMGNLAGKISGSIMIEGVIARLMYLSLYKMHQIALHGYFRVILFTIASLLTRKHKPRMKLH